MIGYASGESKLKYVALTITMANFVRATSSYIRCVSIANMQGKSNACYAYASVAAIAAQYAFISGNFVPLSEQNIIDCSLELGGIFY